MTPTMESRADTMKMTTAKRISPIRLFVKVLCIVFMVEVIVMVFLPLLAPAHFPDVLQAFIDGTLF